MSQLMYCYAANNRAAKPCRLVMTGIAGDCKERFDQIPGQNTWKVAALHPHHRPRPGYDDSKPEFGGVVHRATVTHRAISMS